MDIREDSCHTTIDKVIRQTYTHIGYMHAHQHRAYIYRDIHTFLHTCINSYKKPGMLILVLVLVLKDSLRTFFKSLSLSWSLGIRSLSLSWSLGSGPCPCPGPWGSGPC